MNFYETEGKPKVSNEVFIFLLSRLSVQEQLLYLIFLGPVFLVNFLILIYVSCVRYVNKTKVLKGYEIKSIRLRRNMGEGVW